jgi:hypothetical protein
MIQIIKEFLVMFVILFFVISGLLFGWSAVHGHYAEKVNHQPVQPQKNPLITTLNTRNDERILQGTEILS